MRLDAPVVITIKHEDAPFYKFSVLDRIYSKAMAETLESIAKHTENEYAFGHVKGDTITLVINAHSGKELSELDTQLICSRLSSAATSFFNTYFEKRFREWSYDLSFPTDSYWDEETIDRYGAYLNASLSRKRFSATAKNIANSTLGTLVYNLPTGVVWTMKNGLVWEEE